MHLAANITSQGSAFLGLSVLFLMPATFVNAQVAISSTKLELAHSSRIEPATNGRVTVTTKDAKAGFWKLQSSANLKDWEDEGVYQARAGEARAVQLLKRQPAPRYFRYVNANTVENALTLEPQPLDYAFRGIPTYFRGETITSGFTVVPEIAASPSGGGWGGGGGVAISSSPIPQEAIGRQIDSATAELGRVLFYDRRLSATNKIACATCHKQENAFADPQPLSDGIRERKTARNTLALANLAFSTKDRLFWDLRATSLREAVLLPIQNEREMGLSMEALREKLAEEPFYQDLFTKAFRSPEITDNRIAESLSQFIESIETHESKFDRSFIIGLRHLSERERLGRTLFFGKAQCVECHAFPFFQNDHAANNGLAMEYEDEGLKQVSGKAEDSGLFKTPTLRNIELTAPYMHDGRFKSLEEVVDFYNDGIMPHEGLDPTLTDENGDPKRLNLTNIERDALVDFLTTLTDHTVTKDPRYSDPFKR